jgi:hypothetical protein
MNLVMKRILCLLVAVTPVVAYADKNLEKNGTWDCKKDATVHIGNGGGKFVFKGKCKSISVGGGENKLTIDSVETLDVGGGENKISAKTVTTAVVGGSENEISIDVLGSLDVGGSDNKIVFKKALKGDVKVTGQPQDNKVVGVGNKVIGAATSAGGGAVDVNAIAGVDVNAMTNGAASMGNGGGGTIDCSKNPTFIYNDNNGAFTFTGKCDKISINGNNAKLTIESVKTLAIQGNGTSATVTAVDTIATPGNKNSVTYKKSVTANAKVKVSNPGNGNSVKLVK